jgi:hypothetical protein
MGHRGGMGITPRRSHELKKNLVRKLAWRRIRAADTGEDIPLEEIKPEIERKYPSSVSVVEAYVSAWSRGRTPSERNEAQNGILAPHCAAIATRSLAQVKSQSNRERVAELRARLGR